MTTEYSVSVDWHSDYQNHPDRWINLGRDVLSMVLQDPEHPNFKEAAESVSMLKDDGNLEDYWEECLDDQEPMMNYAYPLHHEPSESEILGIVLNTSCSVMENQGFRRILSLPLWRRNGFESVNRSCLHDLRLYS